MATCSLKTGTPVSKALRNVFVWWNETHPGVMAKSVQSFWVQVDTEYSLTLDQNILTAEKTSSRDFVYTVNLDGSVGHFLILYTYCTA